MCASDTVDGDVLTWVDMKENLVKRIAKVMVSVWHVTKVTRDPFGVGRNIESEGLGAVVSDLGGVVWVAG